MLYAYYTSSDKTLDSIEKELYFCIRKSYDLYHYLMILILDIADYAERRIEIRKNKHQPTYDDLHPNTKFTTNQIIQLLRENRQLNTYTQQYKMSWINHPELIKDMYSSLTESDIYKTYIEETSQSFAEDRKFIEKVFNQIILLTEDLYEILEEQSIYWNDDIEFVISMINKTLKQFHPYSDSSQKLMPMFKDQDDSDFAKNLLRKSIINHDELRGLIKEHSKNWDLERIAFMDILIMQLAITEFIWFPSIPTKVSLNEYIELSKMYSTEKSRNFINGILDKTLKDLKSSEKINKIGRGLIGES
ncbi:MAG: transcription antitermination factor NusB [Mariniphaga sp.]|nr:transcription antitermination factor NusB [Mariniphaga sp.]